LERWLVQRLFIGMASTAQLYKADELKKMHV
jgi:hypothetical protein